MYGKMGMFCVIKAKGKVKTVIESKGGFFCSFCSICRRTE